MSTRTPIDDEVVAAVESAVREFDQPEIVSRRILSWLTELSRGQTGRADNERRFDALRTAIRVDSTADNAEEAGE
jgi:hypothetical protein